ncbi:MULTISPECIES: GLPGLI family protein [unclassified Tenacibaculum]|uniref:GLPGLI family protein n=1 Tax=unclassified Tenacibaculum TaxID=2635139 RepID=UPI001F34C73E|nr:MULTISPECIES: GLPGLI family protein [unclassified Tenacibaculum]MCF2873642.1 GLPGLI family protein [Tenacibaculum sp. Cn5-1]MCF2933798.1 GLPGLI family protein [Tenacibaculum sp. Cn5-34]MCG7509620.1 GLPGLI family protein [Tenacibaculum sp. Cn5-46]
MKCFLSCLILCISISGFSQSNFQGKAVYKSKTTIDPNFGGRQMSEERKKQILQRMKSMLEKTYVLNFTKNESVYKEEEKLATPGTGRGFRFGGMMSGGETYKNLKEHKVLESKESFGKKFLINSSSEKLEWELGSETKQIGNYTCFKATMTKKADGLDWRNMRRRPKKKKSDTTKTKKITDEIEMPKEIKVTAWYTPQIPVSNGPGNYGGLPGLILEINEGRTTILCTEIVMNSSEKVEIKEPKKGKKVSKKEYAEIMKKKMEEMREMFRNRRGGRGGGRGRGF